MFFSCTVKSHFCFNFFCLRKIDKMTGRVAAVEFYQLKGIMNGTLRGKKKIRTSFKKMEGRHNMQGSGWWTAPHPCSNSTLKINFNGLNWLSVINVANKINKIIFFLSACFLEDGLCCVGGTVLTTIA